MLEADPKIEAEAGGVVPGAPLEDALGVVLPVGAPQRVAGAGQKVGVVHQAAAVAVRNRVLVEDVDEAAHHAPASGVAVALVFGPRRVDVDAVGQVAERVGLGVGQQVILGVALHRAAGLLLHVAQAAARRLQLREAQQRHRRQRGKGDAAKGFRLIFFHEVAGEAVARVRLLPLQEPVGQPGDLLGRHRCAPVGGGVEFDGGAQLLGEEERALVVIAVVAVLPRLVRQHERVVSARALQRGRRDGLVAHEQELHQRVVRVAHEALVAAEGLFVGRASRRAGDAGMPFVPPLRRVVVVVAVALAGGGAVVPPADVFVDAPLVGNHVVIEAVAPGDLLAGALGEGRVRVVGDLRQRREIAQRQEEPLAVVAGVVPAAGHGQRGRGVAAEERVVGVFGGTHAGDLPPATLGVEVVEVAALEAVVGKVFHRKGRGKRPLGLDLVEALSVEAGEVGLPDGSPARVFLFEGAFVNERAEGVFGTRLGRALVGVGAVDDVEGPSKARVAPRGGHADLALQPAADGLHVERNFVGQVGGAVAGQERERLGRFGAKAQLRSRQKRLVVVVGRLRAGLLLGDGNSQQQGERCEHPSRAAATIHEARRLIYHGVGECFD